MEKIVRKFYSFQNATKESADIYLYQDIGEGWEGMTGRQFAEDIKAIGGVRSLNIYINSYGGSVFDGVAIYNQLARHKARKNVYIDGIAASIASVVAMAGDTIAIAENGIMMIHDPWGLVIGNAAEMRKTAENLDKVRDTILDTYVARTSGDRDNIAELMRNETWFNADEALELGFADEITAAVTLAAHSDICKYKNVPEKVKAAVDEGDQPRNTPDDKEADAPFKRTQHPRLTAARERLRQRGL